MTGRSSLWAMLGALAVFAVVGGLVVGMAKARPAVAASATPAAPVASCPACPATVIAPTPTKVASSFEDALRSELDWRGMSDVAVIRVSGAEFLLKRADGREVTVKLGAGDRVESVGSSNGTVRFSSTSDDLVTGVALHQPGKAVRQLVSTRQRPGETVFVNHVTGEERAMEARGPMLVNRFLDGAAPSQPAGRSSRSAVRGLSGHSPVSPNCDACMVSYRAAMNQCWQTKAGRMAVALAAVTAGIAACVVASGPAMPICIAGVTLIYAATTSAVISDYDACVRTTAATLNACLVRYECDPAKYPTELAL